MTHYYAYIQCGMRLDANSHIYKVAIGESDDQQAIHAWLEAFAAEHGHFFARWDYSAMVFVDRCLDSIGDNAHPLVHIDGRNLKKSLRNGCDDPACWYAILNRNAWLKQVDSEYRVLSYIRSHRR